MRDYFRLLYCLVFFGAVLLLPACGGDSGSPGGKADNTPPHLVLSSIPIQGAVSGEINLLWTIEDDNPLAVEVWLSKDRGASFTTLLAKVPHESNTSGSYTWNTNLPATPDGDGYQLKLIAIDIPNNRSELLSPVFSINNSGGGSNPTPTITISKPTGSEILHAAVDINWTSNILNQGSVDIKLSADGGRSFPITIASGIGNSGSYQWDSSLYTGNQFRFSLTLTRNGEVSAPSQSLADIQIDNTPPVAVDPVLHFSNPVADGVSISWAAAEDSVSAANTLKYRLYYSDNNNITSPSLVDIYGTDATGADINGGSVTLSGIANAANKYWNVVVRDEVGLRAVYTASRPTGIPVLGFGNQGVVLFDDVGGDEYAEAMVIDNNGKLVVVGSRNAINSLDSDLMVWRYDKQGSPDLTFGDADPAGGKTGFVKLQNPIAGGGDYVGKAVTIDATGKIVVVGYGKISADNGYDVAVWRFLDDGGPDSLFNTTGMAHYPHAGTDNGWAVAIDAQNGIIVSGELDVGAGDTDMLLMRFDAFGKLDTSFGNDGTGIVTRDGAAGGVNSWDSGESLGIDSNGNIVVAGYSTTASLPPDYANYDLAVWRFTSGGLTDFGFANSAGFLTHHNAAGGFGNDRGFRMVIDNNDNIIVVGESVRDYIPPDGTTTNYTFDYDMAIWRITSSGILDDTFNGVGYVTRGLDNTPLVQGSDTNDRAWSVGIDSNNNIVVAGRADIIPLNGVTAIWRYKVDGSPDSGFGDNGLVLQTDPVNFGSNIYNKGIALSIDALDNSIFVCGFTKTADFDYDMMLLHYQ